jgi:aspartate/methionine/tyrosine aminotransferase
LRSSRLPFHAEPNAISRALAALRAAGTPLVDLTESNPTRCGFDYPPDLLMGLSAPEALDYEPHPLGLPVAREAVAAHYARAGLTVDPAHVVLTASTSEAYAWLFKLLCDPGDAVLVPRPSYPLFEHLTRLESVVPVPYDLRHHGRWEIAHESVMAAPDATRAVLVVSPNNPTGSFVAPAEADALARVCGERGWALIADEVFSDYPLEAAHPATGVARDLGVLSFTLGGASKSLGLPQVKLAWMVVDGPAAERDRALAAIELIADTYLSVSTPVQLAAPALIERGAEVRDRIRGRIARNLRVARRAAARHPACTLLEVEGGWSLVARVPATRPEEALVLDLLERERILVHPGYFYDFPHEAFVVMSLLPPEDVFDDAVARALAVLDTAAT